MTTNLWPDQPIAIVPGQPPKRPLLMVTATSTDGYTSTRRAGTTSVHGSIERPGECWAVETRRDRITHSAIAWYFWNREDADRRVDEVNTGTVFWKDSGQRNYDARVVRAMAYELADATQTAPSRRARIVSPPKLCPVHFIALPVTGRCDDCY